MASELRVDRIIPVNGVPTGGGGGVIQVVQSQITVQDQVTTATTWTDTTLTATITPTRSDSKILINCTCHASNGDANQNNDARFRIVRDGTEVCKTRQRFYDYGANGGYVDTTMSMLFLDTPATTSSVTYTLQFYLATGDRVRISESGQGNSSLILMEVSG